MNVDPMDPMVPALAGWLAGVLTSQGHDAFKIASVMPAPPGVVLVCLASGRVLRVRVDLVESPPDGE